MASTSSLVLQNVQNELLTLLKTELTSEEQQLFLQGFYSYLQYDSRKDFVINLDDIFAWLGFSRKDHAKRVLTKGLQKGVHYEVLLPQVGEQKQDGRGGVNKESVVMTVHGFKQLCMQAGTEKARRVRDY
jgi:hypothetical protein